MAQLTVNGIDVEVVAPLAIEDEVLENIQAADLGTLRLFRHGDALRALRVTIQTDYLTDDEKDALEAEILAPGVAAIGGDLFGTSISAHLIPTMLVPGPLADMWTWHFEIQGVGV